MSCMEGDACSLPVLETTVQGREELAKSGGNSDPLKPLENFDQNFLKVESGSVIPRRLIGDLHEWHNDSSIVPTRDLVKSLLREYAEDS